VDAITIFVFVVLHKVPRADVQGLWCLSALGDVGTRYVDTNSTIARFPVVAIVVDLQHGFDRSNFAGFAVDQEFTVAAGTLFTHQIVEANVDVIEFDLNVARRLVTADKSSLYYDSLLTSE